MKKELTRIVPYNKIAPKSLRENGIESFTEIYKRSGTVFDYEITNFEIIQQLRRCLDILEHEKLDRGILKCVVCEDVVDFAALIRFEFETNGGDQK